METLWQSSEEEHHLSLLCHCHSLLSPPIPIEMMSMQTKEVLSFRPCLEAITRSYPGQGSAWHGGWLSNWKGWPRIMRISNSGWFRNKRTNGPGWLSRWTPPSGKSSLRWVRPIWWGLLPWFLSTTAKSGAGPALLSEWEHSLPSPLQNLMAPLPQCHTSSSLACRVSTPPSSSPCIRYPSHWHSSWAPMFLSLTLSLKHKKQGLLTRQHTWRSKWQEGLCWHWGRQHQ